MLIQRNGDGLVLSTPAVEKQEFRNGMSRLGAAVNIITSDGPAGKAGFTASAVCSVTDDPPTLLVCLNRSASVYPMFSKNRALCVNSLRPGHEDLSQLFGGKTPMEERFANGAWATLVSGAPVLQDAAVSFDCQMDSVTDVGTHSIIFCTVIAVSLHNEAQALVYFDRKYRHI